MTQSPYTPPGSPQPIHYGTYYPGPPQDALAPARRAAMMTYIIGGLVIAMGACCVGFSALLPQMLQQQPQMASEMNQIPGFTPELGQKLLLGLGIAAALLGVGMLILGRFVRAGGTGAIA